MDAPEGPCVWNGIGGDGDVEVQKSIRAGLAVRHRRDDTDVPCHPLQQRELTYDDGPTIGACKTALVQAAEPAGLTSGQNGAGDRLV